MDGNPAFTVHTTLHAFSAAVNLKAVVPNHFRLAAPYKEKYNLRHL